jgi:translation initiation factor 3 subunit A
MLLMFSFPQAKHSVPQYVYPELKNLFNILEVDFHPLKLYENVKPCMDFIAQNDDLAQYVPALEDIIVTRILKQVTFS